jgi:hypothetical protein
MTTTHASSDKSTFTGPSDPIAILKGFASLRRLTGTYPAGHPMIRQKLAELGDLVNGHVRHTPVLRIDVIQGDVCSMARRPAAKPSNQQLIASLTLGVTASTSIGRARRAPHGSRIPLATSGPGKSVAAQLAERHVKHISLGNCCRSTRWRVSAGPMRRPVLSIRPMRNRSCWRSRPSKTPPRASH